MVAIKESSVRKTPKQAPIDRYLVFGASVRAPACEACHKQGRTVKLTPTYRRLFGDRQISRFVCPTCATKYAVITRMN